MIKNDEFFIARIRLTFYYSLTAVVILGGSSVILYNIILSNLTDSIRDSVNDPIIGRMFLDRAQDILLSRFLTIDLALIVFIVILGFLLTYKILEPIKNNMDKQKRFIADASHELRTPISVIISGLEVNLNNKKLDLVGAKKTMEDSLSEMREFSRLSNSLLDISKYEGREQVDYEKFIINDLVKSVIEKNKIFADKKEIIIETKLESEVAVFGNKLELGRVFFNILDNAIKYTGTKGKIMIIDKVDSKKYTVSFNDNGVGISPEMISKVFDPFFRGDASRTTSGAGLGLTLSKNIIENHKGTITIKSEENKGTNVIISLPLSS